MKVRILSGNQAGLVVEQRKDEAEMNIASGFAEAVSDAPVQPAAPATHDEVKPAQVPHVASPKASAKPKGQR